MKKIYMYLKKYGFKLINFENYSPLEQINIAENKNYDRLSGIKFS